MFTFFRTAEPCSTRIRKFCLLRKCQRTKIPLRIGRNDVHKSHSHMVKFMFTDVMMQRADEMSSTSTGQANSFFKVNLVILPFTFVRKTPERKKNQEFVFVFFFYCFVVFQSFFHFAPNRITLRSKKWWKLFQAVKIRNGTRSQICKQNARIRTLPTSRSTSSWWPDATASSK